MIQTLACSFKTAVCNLYIEREFIFIPSLTTFSDNVHALYTDLLYSRLLLFGMSDRSVCFYSL